MPQRILDRLLTWSLLVGVGSPVIARAPASGPVVSTRPSGAVVLAWDGSGDFGPQTPGTRTSGWNEALACCARQSRDLYVAGGFGGRKAIYHIEETVRLPATQDFKIDGGVYVINYRGRPEEDAVVIDSAMNC